jgi:predicted  nucleic acid-binding Zn-ribbon protein
VSLADALEACKQDLAAETARCTTLEAQMREATARFEREMREAAARFEREIKDANEKILLLQTKNLNLTKQVEELKEQLIKMTKRAKIAEKELAIATKECEDLRRKLERAYEELDVAQATIQGLQSRVDDLTEKVVLAQKALAVAEDEKKQLARDLAAARAEMQRLLDMIKTLQAHITHLEAQLIEKDDAIRHLQYKLDLCPYKCKKIDMPAPVSPPPEPEPEEDATKYVGVGMVVRVETGKPFPLIKKIAPDGSAAECPLMAVDDALLEVDGKDCRGKSVADMTALFLGPVGSSVTVKGHTLSDHDHPPDRPSYSVTLVRGKKGQSPVKEVKKPQPSVVAAAGPVQTTSDEARLTRSLEEVAQLQTLLAAARKETEDVAKRCTDLESAARETILKQQQREADEAAGETQQALARAQGELATLSQQLESKSRHLEEALQETSGIKKAARLAQEETKDLQKKLSTTASEMEALRKRVRDLEAELKKSQNTGPDTQLQDLKDESERMRQETEKQRKSVKELTVALRTMSQAEITAKEEIFSLQTQLETANVKMKQLQNSASTATSPTPLRVASPPPAADDEELSARRSSMPAGGLMGAAASRSFKIAPGPRPQSFAGGASPPGSPAMGVGVGMEITSSSPYVVKKLVEAGPAYNCGRICVGDTLSAIDDNEVSLLHIDLVKAMLVGDNGSSVKLTLEKQSDKSEYNVKVLRGKQHSKPRFM